MTDPRIYFAAETDDKMLIKRCLERFGWRIGALRESGIMRRAASLLSSYYGHGTRGDSDSSSTALGGEQGELLLFTLNGVKPVVTTALGLIFGQRPTVKPKAVNGNASALAQTRLAMQLWEYYSTKLSGQDVELKTVRGGLLASAWTLGQAWQPKDGEEWGVDPDTGQVQYTGDISLFALPPWRVAWDFSATEPDARKWVLFRRPVSRHDTAARVTDEATREKLLTLNSGGIADWRGIVAKSTITSSIGALDYLLGEVLPDEDVLWVWELRHLPSPALPGGRLVRFVEPDIILFDSAKHDAGYPYDPKDLHCYEYSPERVVAGTMGHTGMFDLNGGQEVMDLITVSMGTGINMLGNFFLWQEKSGGKPEVERIANGPTVLESSVKPEVLDFPAMKPELLQAADFIQTAMRAAAALNDTVMGSPEKGMPASAQALQRAQAVQYNQVAQAEAVKLVSRNANGILKLLQRFADQKRTAELAGDAGAYELKEFSKGDIEGVPGFTVEPVDPLSQSFEHRQALAEMLITAGVLQPDDLLSFVETGTLKSATAHKKLARESVERNQALLFKGVGLPPVDMEQSMATGAPVFVDDGQEHVRILKTDPHNIAIPMYLAVVANPESRGDLKLLQPAIDAVAESFRLWASLTPDECQAYGIPPLPSHLAPPVPPPPGEEGAPPDEGGGAPPGGPAEPASELPAPPENPLTGEQPAPEATGL